MNEWKIKLINLLVGAVVGVALALLLSAIAGCSVHEALGIQRH